MNNTDCPLCDAKPEDGQALAFHLAAEHSAVEIGGRRLARAKSGRILCWCGSFWKLQPRLSVLPHDWQTDKRDWSEHLKRRGGAAAHILEITLGVKRK